MKNTRYETNLRALLTPALTAAALSLAMAGCSQADNTAKIPAVPTSSSSSSAMAMSSESSSVMASKYADGSYSATGGYTSPGGAESVDVSLTLKDGVITVAAFKGNAQRPISVKMQGQFAAGFTEQVVGKSIDQLSLSVVNGSSLTPKGFMDAVTKIKLEAAV